MTVTVTVAVTVIASHSHVQENRWSGVEDMSRGGTFGDYVLRLLSVCLFVFCRLPFYILDTSFFLVRNEGASGPDAHSVNVGF